MIGCGYEKTPFGEPICIYIRNCRIPWIKCVKRLTGGGSKTEIICIPCADDRESGLQVGVEPVCEECSERVIRGHDHSAFEQ